MRTAPLLRIPVERTADNGLRRKSQIMVDKAQTVSRDKIGDTLGRLHVDTPVDEAVLADLRRRLGREPLGH